MSPRPLQGNHSALRRRRLESDAENNKTTYVTLCGLEKSQRDVADLTENAVKMLTYFNNDAFLEALARRLVDRNM